MAEYPTTRSGLTVATRSFPRDVTPNPNPPIGTVGPNVPAGFGDTHVMYPEWDPPIEAQAWDGWPTGWAVPSNYTAGGLGGRISTVFSAIDLNARIVGSLPIYAVRGGNVIASPAWMRNPAAGLYPSWTEAVEQIVWSYQRRGEAILWALNRYADGTVRSWMVLDPDTVDIIRGSDGFPSYTLLGWNDTVTADMFDTVDGDVPWVARLDPDDVLHLKYASWPGELRGHSPLEAVAANMGAAWAYQRSAGDLAHRGGIPWGVLSAPYELTQEEVDKLRGQWTDQASRRGGAPAITSGNFKLETFNVTPQEMELLRLREFDESRVAVALGVQPYQLGLSQGGGLSYANVRDIFDYHWRATLRPMTRKIASAITQWALPHGQQMRFNPDQYVRPAIDQRVEAYKALVKMGVLTADEIRTMEDLAGDPDDDPETTGIAEQEVTYG